MRGTKQERALEFWRGELDHLGRKCNKAPPGSRDYRRVRRAFGKVDVLKPVVWAQREASERMLMDREVGT